MSESSLSLAYSDIAARVARYLGYPTSTGDMSASQLNDVNDAIDSGLRQFYHPPAIAGYRLPHIWSFLQPEATLTLAAADSTYDLPDNYGGGITQFNYSSASNPYQPVRIVPIGAIRLKQQAGTSSGYPTEAAVTPKTSAGTAGQRWQVEFWPTPDSAYTLYYRYSVLCNQLSTSAPYPLGGERHAETILASCLAAAEEILNQERGIMYQRFMERLTASIAADEEDAPHSIGGTVGGWLADGMAGQMRRHDTWATSVPYV